MPYWLRKFIVAFVAVLTFGTIVPPLHSPTEKSAASKPDLVNQGHVDTTAPQETVEYADDEESEQEELLSKPWQEVAASLSDAAEMKTQLVSYTIQHAEKQGYRKFGSMISNKVGDEYRNVILPKIGQAMEILGKELDSDDMKNLVVTEDPSNGYGERIFHIYNGKTGEDLIRFDVRREQPPKEGHWFNFHYHTNKDQFKQHHELGRIYWDKNMPPKWMA